MNVQKFCGVELFSWENWDEMGVGLLSFYNPIWLLDSMKQYNAHCLDISIDGELEIFDELGQEIVWSGYVIDIPEVRRAIHKEVVEYAESIVIAGTEDQCKAVIALAKELENKFLK